MIEMGRERWAAFCHRDVWRGSLGSIISSCGSNSSPSIYFFFFFWDYLVHTGRGCFVDEFQT